MLFRSSDIRCKWCKIGLITCKLQFLRWTCLIGEGVNKLCTVLCGERYHEGDKNPAVIFTPTINNEGLLTLTSILLNCQYLSQSILL